MNNGGRKVKQFQLSVTKTELEWIEEESKQHDLTVSQILQQLVRNAMAQKKEVK